jgi:putative lipoprotein
MTRRAPASRVLLGGLLLGLLQCSRAQEKGPSDAQVTPYTPSSSQPASLGGTSWRLVRFQRGDGTTLTPDDRDKYTIVFATDGRVSARINCNRGMGTWKSKGPQLEFGPLALTRAFCLPEPIHDQMLKQWEYVRSYVIKRGHLYLSLMADGGIYEFEPMKPEDTIKGTVRGTATYRERMALPPGAVLEATLEDVSRADAPGKVIGRTRLEHLHNPPIRFAIPYDPSRIDPRRSYVVRAQILVDEKPFFTTDQKYPVLTAGRGEEVELMLRRPAAQGGGGPSLSLENTYWKLTQLGNAPVSGTQIEPHLVLDPTTRRVTGSGGCNQLSGGYQVNGDRLTLSQTVSTMKACMKGMETEQAFLKALDQVRGWQITGQQLELLDESGKVLARFEGRRAFE